MQLPEVVDVSWPASAPAAMRVQLSTVCLRELDEIFDASTAVLGKLQRTPYAVRVATGSTPAPSFVFRVRLTIPPAARGSSPQVFARIIERGQDEEHEIFHDIESELRDGQLVFDVSSVHLLKKGRSPYPYEIVFIVGWE